MRIKQVNNTEGHWQSFVARSLKEIEAIRPIWEEMQRDETFPKHNADIDKYIATVGAMNSNVQPYVVLMKQGGKPMVMIVGRVEKQRLVCRIGYKVLCKPAI